MLDFYLKRIATTFVADIWLRTRNIIEQLPIRPIDFADPADRERHDRMVALVEEMLALHRQLAAARTDHERTNLKRQIDAADRRIDRLVYDLYNLTEAEIRLVEKKLLPRERFVIILIVGMSNKVRRNKGGVKKCFRQRNR